MNAAIPLQPDRDAESPLSVFESAAVVRLSPGDVVLLRCAQRLTDADLARLMSLLNTLFPGNESVILGPGQDIAVLRPEPGLVGRMWRRVFSRKALA